MAFFSGIAAAIGGAFASISSFIGGLGAIGTFLLKTAVGIGLNLLAKAIAGQPDEPQFSVQGTLQAGGDVPRSFVFGRTVTAGSLVYANTWGKAGKTPNAYFTQVIALSDVPITGISQLWVNGEPVTIDTGDASYGDWGFPVVEYAKGSNNHMWVKFYDGTQTVADPFLAGTVSSGTRPWSSTRVGRGVAYAVITSQVEEELFTGFPQFKFEVQGAKLYDITKDSTAGGSGAHRRSDPATWGGDGDDLPAVQIYNLLLGITYGGAWLYGLQNLPSVRLPSADWIAQINKCRALVATTTGTEKQYLTGGEIHVGAQIADAVDAILTGCQGRLSESGGIYKIYVGEPDAPVFAFSDDDILSTESQEFTPFFGLADTINGINASYPEPAEAWNTKSAPALFNTTFEAEDGNRRLMADVQLDMVYRSTQVQRLMKSALAEGRRARRHTLVLSPAAWILEPGDIVSWTSNRNGYEAKLFRVDGVADRANLDVMLDLTEVDPADYDWNPSTDYKPPVFGPLGPNRPSPQPIVDWYAEASTIPDNTGSGRRPAILLAWDGDQVDVAAVAFEVRLATSGTVVYRGRTDNVAVASILISQSLLPLTAYQVRGRYVPGSDRPWEWSGWLSVTTLDIRLGDQDVYLPGMIEDIEEFVGDATEWLRDGSRELIWMAEQFALRTADQDAANYTDKQQLKIELVSKAGEITAAYTDAITVATGPNSAIGQRLTTIEATIPTLATASAVTLLSAQVSSIGGQVSAQADSITALFVAMGGSSAAVNVRMSASAGPAGYAARYGIEARTGGAGAYRSAAMFIDVPASALSPTRVAFVADQFVVTDGTNNAAPFVFTGGVAYMENARIGDVLFRRQRSFNGKLDIRGDGSNASIEIFT
ncbi:phage tail protein [Mesorhizobium sp. DCY119]|uniref:phage tail protein n=1 Tax=Mesorhizobium sp. DCY119 TaxID=2108445 RepID=UPI000E6BB689|nr:phage tail protein [Mesorhizobium sp. DCY119]RJG46494.1 phage tail protein [Mesorhizobium sp. DCY119]